VEKRAVEKIDIVDKAGDNMRYNRLLRVRDKNIV